MVLDHYYYQLATTISARQQVQLAVRQVAAIIQTVFQSEGFATPGLSADALEAAEQLLAKVANPLFLLSAEGQELLHKHFAVPVMKSIDDLGGDSTMETAARYASAQGRPVSPMVITPPPGSVAQDSPSPPTLPPPAA